MEFVVSPIAATPAAETGGALLALQPGRVVEAVVLRALDASHVQLAIGASLVEALTETPLAAGARVQLSVQASAEGLKLLLVKSLGLDGQAPAGGRMGPNAPASGATASGATGSGAAGSSAPVQQAAPSPPPSASPAAQALAAAVRAAAPVQNGLAPLFADAAMALALNGMPDAAKQAALRLLSFRLPVDQAMEAEQIRRAVARSGLFLEASLDAAASAPAAAGRAPGSVMPADMKAAIAMLRAALAEWSASHGGAPAPPGRAAASSSGPAGARSEAGPTPSPSPPAARATGALRPEAIGAQALHRALLQAASSVPSGDAMPAAAAPAATAAQSAPPASPTVNAHPHEDRPPPPYRGAAPSAQPAVAAAIAAGDPADLVAHVLIADADAALARHTLLQAASLPDPSGAPSSQADGAASRWAFEIPFATPQGAAVAQFEIARDGNSRAGEAVAPVWRARFCLDIEPLGPVHAQVAVSGGRAAVTLWAERAASAEKLRDDAPTLAEALRAAELEPSEVQVRDGAPRSPAARLPAGRFLDRAS